MAPPTKREFNIKASFLHDDEWDPNDDLSVNSSSFGSTDSHLEKLLEQSELSTTNPTVDGSAHDNSVIDASTHKIPQFNSSRVSINSDAPSEETSSAHISGYGFNSALRRASESTVSASHKSNESPNELAANVALSVKSNFLKNIPQSLVEDYNNRDIIGHFSTTEIILGPLLGSGEFSHVYEIKSFKPDSTKEATLNEPQINKRLYMKNRERYHDTKKACYAVKHLRPTLVEKYSKLEYAQSASDLALEAEFLSVCQHPNIIKLRGVSFSGAGGFAQGPKGYFLIIDRLNETLDTRIKRWKKEKRKALSKNGKKKKETVVTKGLKSLATKRLSAEDISRQESMANYNGEISEDQVDVGLQISSALMYLHGKNIMFRDLKPQNVGFDVRGDVKLFDFGLATVMPPNGDPYDEKFEMSGAGSPRYMAPEVLVDPPEPYNMKADVYTFGIVLWEMFALEVPYKDIKSRGRLMDFVVEQEGRPPINEAWPEPIKELLQQIFEADSSKRPTVQLFYNMLRFHLLEISARDQTKLEPRYIERRRSSTSIRALMETQRGKDDEKKLFTGKKSILRRFQSAPPDDEPRRATVDNGEVAAPRRRITTRLRNKFSLSIKREE